MKRYLYTTLLLLAAAATLSAAQLPDSVKQASDAEYRIEKGLNFDVSFGLGFGRMEFSQIGSSFTPAHVTNIPSFPNWNVGLGVNYYFLPWMGIGTGLQFSTYANTSLLNKPWVVSGFDYQGDRYDFTSTPTNLSERQGLYMVELPVSLRFRTFKQRLGFHGVAGVKLGVSVHDYYQLSGGSFHNEVTYDYWALTVMDNIPGVIEDFNVSPSSGNIGYRLHGLNIGAYSEIGMLIRLHQRLDLLLALTATYYFTDALGAGSSSLLGFDESFKPGEYPSPFSVRDNSGNLQSVTYDGVLRTNEVQELHPWSLALKVGLSINAGKTQAKREYDKQERARRRAEKEAARLAREAERLARLEAEERARREADSLRQLELAAVEVQPVDTTPVPTRCDSIREQILALIAECDLNLCDLCPVIHDTIYIYPQDTIAQVDTTSMVEVTPTQELEQIMQSAVIWFKLDDTIPILEPEDILTRIAAVLVSHPDQKVEVNGHACVLGKPAYNKKLAMRRAQAVANQLIELGVKPEQMIVQSLGDDVPYRYNGKHQLDKDRRVEVLPVTDQPAAQPDTSLPTIEVVLAGSRLAQIARRYYGNPEYWVFIYEANKGKIKDPDNLPAKAEIVVPDLTERLKGKSQAEIDQLIQQLKQTE